MSVGKHALTQAVDARADEELVSFWEQAWPQAMACWSPYLKLGAPKLCLSTTESQKAGLQGSFAAIRLDNQRIVIDLEQVRKYHVEDYATEVLAHEIGHHMLAPGTMSDHLRCLARIRRGLPTLEQHVPMIANLYTDLLVNDRLQRSAGLRMDQVFRALIDTTNVPSHLWTLYLRIMEELWDLEPHELGSGATDDRLEGDAWLGARVIRVYGADWIDGAGRFAALVLPYLAEDTDALKDTDRHGDTIGAGEGSTPNGLAALDDGELNGSLHPSKDPRIVGDQAPLPRSAGDAQAKGAQGLGQSRPPYEYAQILRDAGMELSDLDAAAMYYRELALPHLVPFPRRLAPPVSDPLPEGLEPWALGDPLDDLDWFQSVLVSPTVFPGLTTVQRVWGNSEGPDPAEQPVDLDIYVDSSGSMPDPTVTLSYPALAGAIVCLSALRAGSAVQATLWSGPGQVLTTDGFIRDPNRILRVLIGYFGGSTQFPLGVLRSTYDPSRVLRRSVHLLQISDDGIDTMVAENDSRNDDGWSARQAMQRAGGGGTMVLQLYAPLDQQPQTREVATVAGIPFENSPLETIRNLRDVEGWRVYVVQTLEELLGFARAFAKEHYQPKPSAKPIAGSRQ
jgi:hypothetical protein